ANLAPDRSAHIFVLHDDVPADARARVGRGWPARCTMEWLPIDSSRFSAAPLWGTMSVTTYYRLAIADVLPATIGKALWLDTDLIIGADLGALWDLDVT